MLNRGGNEWAPKGEAELIKSFLEGKKENARRRSGGQAHPEMKSET
jgi:hypothetical protein